MTGCVLVNIKLYKGLILRVDDEQKEVRAIEIGACRGIHLHGALVEPFLDPISMENV
jgi:hypothetical protein